MPKAQLSAEQPTTKETQTYQDRTAAAAAKSLQSVSKSVRPHRRQPTRLPRPWDSPGKNTGVGCHSPNEKKEEPQRDGQEEQTSVCVLSAKLCWTRCDPMDCRPPGSSVHGILQARIREWVAISSFRGTS